LADIQVVKPHQREVEVASGAMTRLAGVSRGLTGAEGIHLAVAVVPPGCSSTPHRNTNCESAIYITRGRGRFLVGDRLEKALEFQAGDFIYVPPGAVHQPVNDGDEPVEMVVARNAPVELVEDYTVPAGERLTGD
jgi:uncharacterized RmlC-like cupin family protein